MFIICFLGFYCSKLCLLLVILKYKLNYNVVIVLLISFKTRDKSYTHTQQYILIHLLFITHVIHTLFQYKFYYFMLSAFYIYIYTSMAIPAFLQPLYSLFPRVTSDQFKKQNSIILT